MTNDECVQIIRQMTKDGVVKTKGAYEVAHFEKLGFHKNHSSMIISMAVLSNMLGLKSYEKFILEHKDPYDFMLRTKVPRNSRLVLVKGDVDVLQQNICRYYPSIGGGKLVKIMPPLKKGENERRLSIDSEWEVSTCNDMSNFKWDVNYDYYISKAKELIDSVIKTHEFGTPF